MSWAAWRTWSSRRTAPPSTRSRPSTAPTLASRRAATYTCLCTQPTPTLTLTLTLPLTLDPDQVRNCSVVLQSACLAAAYAKDGVTEMRLGWDGGDTLQLYEGFSIVGYPQSYRWAERRVVEGDGG